VLVSDGLLLALVFQNLYRLNVVTADGTYDPKFQSTYWTRWVMGVISEIILAQLIYVPLLKAPITGASALPATIGQPILPLFGGYSVDLVHGILSHTIDTVASFFRVSGDPAAENRARVTGRDVGEANQGLRSGRPIAWTSARMRSATYPQLDAGRPKLLLRTPSD
jgi:hypothetical protein